ncbi:MAG: LPP20 family lipoprotein, partial [Muribaculaceae bacterium]|nr:LPP20 family lipoprotein [Muribaculaceae bacterium]
MNKLLIIFLSIIFPFVAFAQSKSDKAKAEAIKLDDSYIYGEGWGETQADAGQQALDNLLSQIGVSVQKTFTYDYKESSANDKDEFKSDVNIVTNTYSNATITNSEILPIRDGNKGYYVLRYMKRTELQKMFDQRRDRVEDYVRNAMRAEEKGKIDDALRFLNWAYVLVHSLQYPGEVKMKVLGEERLLIHWIPTQIRDILDQIDVKVANIKPDNTIDLLFTYKGEPVEALDFTYWNGKFNSALTSVKDGMGQASFPPSYTPTEIALSVETQYAESAMSDKEIEMMLQNFKNVSYPTARKVIGTEGKTLKEDKAAKKDLQAQVEAGKREGVTPLDKKYTKDYEAVIKDVLKSVSTKNYAPNPANFTDEGLEMFKQLIHYGDATLIGTPNPGYYPFGDRVVCRSVPMQFKFKSNNRTFIEDVTFTFSPDKKIESLAFGLGNAARRDIFEQGGDVWGDSIKMVLVTFLENYKTAFALKRLDYIKSIFDENAYIIVGHKLQKMQQLPDGQGYSAVTQYEFQHKTKEEYMT